jgi:hypothetical protein
MLLRRQICRFHDACLKPCTYGRILVLEEITINFSESSCQTSEEKGPRMHALLDWGEDMSNFISIHGVSWFKRSDNIMVQYAVMLLTITVIIVLPFVVISKSKIIVISINL